MRDSEIKHLQRGCLSVQQAPDGHVHRHRLASLAFKGEDVHGAEATWIVTAPVARAIAVLERFQPQDQPYLLAPAPSTRRRSAFPVPNSNTTNKDIAFLISWITAYCDDRSRPDGIPLERGQLPRLTTRQFRRTLAWFIARRPGGAIAGALQYRHQCIQMFEGYAGTSDSGFRDEAEAEQAPRPWPAPRRDGRRRRPPDAGWACRRRGRSPARRVRPAQRLRRPGRH
jgi:hypothetical protein